LFPSSPFLLLPRHPTPPPHLSQKENPPFSPTFLLPAPLVLEVHPRFFFDHPPSFLFPLWVLRAHSVTFHVGFTLSFSLLSPYPPFFPLFSFASSPINFSISLPIYEIRLFFLRCVPLYLPFLLIRSPFRIILVVVPSYWSPSPNNSSLAAFCPFFLLVVSFIASLIRYFLLPLPLLLFFFAIWARLFPL